MKRAYRVTCDRLVRPAIVAAETAGAARASVLRSAREAGYALKFADLRVRRAPEFDAVVYERTAASSW